MIMISVALFDRGPPLRSEATRRYSKLQNVATAVRYGNRLRNLSKPEALFFRSPDVAFAHRTSAFQGA